MKTRFIFYLSILISLATNAQIKDPVWNTRETEKTIQWQSIQSRCARNLQPGFDSTWASQFQSTLDEVIQNNTAKGASVAVYTPEEGLWTGVSGISYEGVPITRDMRFGIGSNTKLFVSVALLKLQEQGKLTLDDHLYQWLPSIPHVDSSATIRQLLTHQSGIWDFWNDEPSLLGQLWNDTSRFWTTDEVLASLGSPHFSPGNGFSYSNTNYMLAALIMEAVTDKSWVQNLHELIFDPLSLDSTFVGAFEPSNGPVAAEWDTYNNILIINSPMTAEFSQAHAAGAILSTASEIVQWYNALFNGLVISNGSLQELLDFEPMSLYGLGIFVGVKDEKLIYNHSGGLIGYTSLVLYDISRKAVICFLFNDRYEWEDKLGPLIDLFFYEYPKKPYDAVITLIAEPWGHYCTNDIAPEISLTNFGSLPLTSATINYRLDEEAASVFEWTGTLDPGDTIKVALPSVTASEGSHTFKCYTSLPNGQPDGYSFYDTLESNFYVNLLTPSTSGIFEGFDGNGFPREGWTLNSSSVIQWGETSLARLDGKGSAVVNNYEWSGTFGQYHDLQLPVLNVSNLANNEISFDYAYAAYPGYYGDSLEVSVSEDCGETWQTLWYSGGYSLTTAGFISDMFWPKNSGQWSHVSLTLSDFEGDILIRFRARNGISNNLFVDNIAVGWVGVQESAVGSQQSAVSSYPNPFTGFTTLEYELEHAANVNLSIYNCLGQRVVVLADDEQAAGKQQVRWEAEGMPAGIYFYRLTTNDCRLTTGKLVLK